MKRIIYWIICWWTGHDLVNPIGEWDCIRCGRQLSYDEVVSPCAKENLKRWIRDRLSWFLKCKDCGLRFGKHDEKVEHPPF